MIAYRKEIDGLRAIAVLSVIFFHAGFETFKGGFVGVDVFFVISGYLITSIILKEKDEGVFSLKRFYERRARRILPALFFVIFCTMPFAWVWLFPKDFLLYLQSVLATVFFCANWFFSFKSNYFAQEVDYYPLLHTWSLAVEEQFYILFPLLLLYGLRLGKKQLFGLLLLFGVLGVVFTQQAVLANATSAFFGFLSRGWVMLFGAMLVFFPKPIMSRFLKQSLSFVGALCICLSVFCFDNTILYPSSYTMVPVLGASLIILYADVETFIGRMLGWRFLVATGLISYSLYLWHQPVFAFARVRSVNELTETAYVGLILIIFFLSYISWKFIESPFRLSKIKVHTCVSVFLLAQCILMLSVFLGLHGAGNIKKFGNTALQVLNVANDKKHMDACLSGADVGNMHCSIGGKMPPNVMLLGDSHAGTLLKVLSDGMKLKSIGGIAFIRNGCLPALNIERVDRSDYCASLIRNAFAYLNHHAVHTVIVVGRWTALFQGIGFDNYEGGREAFALQFVPFINGKKVFLMNESDRRAYVLRAYMETLNKLLDLKMNVILVYPIPEVGWNVPYYMAKKMYFEGALLESLNVSTSYALYKARHKKVIDMFDGLGERSNLIRIYPDKILCNTYMKDRCIASLNGKPFYFDDDHLSNVGAKLVVDEIMKHIR